MSDGSKIQWTDATWNPTTGCTKVSPGCANCYIERTPAFRIAGRKFVKGATDLRLHKDRLKQPLHWNNPRRVFVNSLSDLFHDDVPNSFIDQVFAVMALAPKHTFQVLTKRPDRMRAYVTSRNGYCSGVWFAAEKLKASPPREHWYHAARTFDWPLPNVWLGVSVENQHFADERIPLLLETPAAVRFISAEPLLGPVDLTHGVSTPYCVVKDRHSAESCDIRRLDWVIVGGESGHGARSFDPTWARLILNQCHRAGVPVFVKQLGSNVRMPREEWESGSRIRDRWVNGRAILVDSKGGDPAEWPEELRVRQFPRV
jgi:protein gp37